MAIERTIRQERILEPPLWSASNSRPWTFPLGDGSFKGRHELLIGLCRAVPASAPESYPGRPLILVVRGCFHPVFVSRQNQPKKNEYNGLTVCVFLQERDGCRLAQQPRKPVRVGLDGRPSGPEID